MPNRRKMWIYVPPKPKVPEKLEIETTQKAAELVEKVLKPMHVKPPPGNMQFNYVVDIYTKWYRRYFYFCSKYRCPSPDAFSPFFEHKFARMEYLGRTKRFNLSFMRHTGEWIEIYPDLSLDKCLAAIKDDPYFQP